VHVVDAGDVESWPRMGKDEVARRLALRVAAALGRR
jgi:phosphopantothenoylcysteine decarboxylase/phosphopantothenate--cysteine ligase